MNLLVFYPGPRPIWGGGLTIYSESILERLQKDGHNIVSLFPGFNKDNDIFSINYHSKIKGVQHYSLNNYEFSLCYELSNKANIIAAFSKFLIKHKINYFMSMTTIGIHLELLLALEKLNIKKILSVHEFSPICIKSDLFNWKDEICSSYENGKGCQMCNKRILDKMIHSNSRKLFVAFPFAIKFYPIFRKMNLNNFFRFVLGLLKVTQPESNINDLQSQYYVNYRTYQEKLLNKFDFIIFNSYKTKNTYDRYFEFKKDRIAVLYPSHKFVFDNRLKFNKKYNDDSKLTFGYLGPLSVAKGYNKLLNVFSSISDFDFELRIYGHGNKISSNNNNIKHFGTYDLKNIIKIMKHLDVLILPSESLETFGFTVLEAISFGIPCLVTNNSGVSELINAYEIGKVFSVDIDGNQLRDTILTLINSPKKLNKLKENILKMDFPLDFENHYNTLIEIITSI